MRLLVGPHGPLSYLGVAQLHLNPPICLLRSDSLCRPLPSRLVHHPVPKAKAVEKFNERLVAAGKA